MQNSCLHIYIYQKFRGNSRNKRVTSRKFRIYSRKLCVISRRFRVIPEVSRYFANIYIHVYQKPYENEQIGFCRSSCFHIWLKKSEFIKKCSVNNLNHDFSCWNENSDRYWGHFIINNVNQVLRHFFINSTILLQVKIWGHFKHFKKYTYMCICIHLCTFFCHVCVSLL